MVKYSWVWLCFLSLICFLMSCTGKKTQLNDGAPLVSSDTLIPVIQPEQEPEEEKVEAPTRVDELFDNFTKWVKETLDIRKDPYIRIISVLVGVK